MPQTRLETDRLILRHFEVEDADAVLRFGNHPEVTRYTGDADQIVTLDDAVRVIQQTWHVDYETYGYGRLAIEVKETHEVIGFCGLKFLPEYGRPDIGYRMLPEFWGNRDGSRSRCHEARPGNSEAARHNGDRDDR